MMADLTLATVAVTEHTDGLRNTLELIPINAYTRSNWSTFIQFNSTTLMLLKYAEKCMFLLRVRVHFVWCCVCILLRLIIFSFEYILNSIDQID